MTFKGLWKLTLFLLIGSLLAGCFAIFTIDGTSHAIMYILFWLLCTSLCVVTGAMSIKFFGMGKIPGILLISFLTFIGFVCSSPIGLRIVVGPSILIPLFLWIIVLLILVKKEIAEKLEEFK